MAQNRYYILPNPPADQSSLWGIVVETPESVVTFKNDTFMVVKLPEHDDNNHPIFNGITEYDNAGVKVELRKAKYQ